jgi:hypothetical protein
MDAVQRLIDQRDDEEGNEDHADRAGAISEESDVKVLRLLGVLKGSACYPVASHNGPAARKMLQVTGRSLKDPSRADWTGSSLSALRDCSDVARALGVNIQFMTHGENAHVLATITPDTYAEVSNTAFIRGMTTISATIERVGGATEAHCGLRVADQARRMVICHVRGDELVRRLGQYIYQTVVVTGYATWFRHNMRLKTIDITDFEAPKNGSIIDALRRIREASGNAWQDVPDAKRHILELRSA